ncbi:hypothetical protein K456DRAFT_1726278 [Colletotrichum gloeosporioides 23]|nr:hypothetical protein K456DRAFT_1726278 [Colletotrichum gloeosporioides 23]
MSFSGNARVTSSRSSFTATKGSSNIYTSSNYHAAIQAALNSISSSQHVSIIASGSISANTITIASGKIFKGCSTINVATRSSRGAIESTNTQGVQIPYLIMTGNPYFRLRFSRTKDLTLGAITMNLSGGLGIRFNRNLTSVTHFSSPPTFRHPKNASPP